MKRARKIVLWIVGIVAVAFGLGWSALAFYVNGPSGRRAAAEQIGRLVGMKVEVDHFAVGANSTSIGLRIPDSNAESPGDLIQIGSLQTDITLFELLGGTIAPTAVTAKDVEILLRLDADGNLLTAFPKSTETGPTPTVPAIHFERVRLRIQQAGHPEFIFGDVAGQLRREGDDLVLAGQTDEPKWGPWRITGRFGPGSPGGPIQLHSDSAPFVDSLLRSIPYVPADLWDQLAPTGPTAATVTLTRRPGQILGYRVELRPVQATLRFPAADATVTDVTGTIVVENGRVTIAGGNVKLADGTIAVEGDYRFDKLERVFALKLRANGIDIRRLPESWGLPPMIEGRLQGRAELEFHVGADGKWDPRGGGAGTVEGATFAGLPATIRLKLSGRNGRYRFDPAE